jgi:soluble lytic murein transglycosylase-like protein
MLLLLIASALANVPNAAQSSLRKGDCPNFHQTIGDAASPVAQMARARCGNTDGLRTLGESDDPLAKWARLALARKLSKSNPAELTFLLEGLAFPGEAGEEARLLRAQALVALGRSLEARPDLRLLLNGKHGPEARYLLSVGAEDRGDLPAAQKTYESLWAKFPASPWALAAEKRLAEMGKSPSIATQAGQALLLLRARTLVKMNRPKEAVVLFKRLLEKGVLSGTTDLLEFAMANFWARDYAGAIAIWETLDPINSKQITAEAFFHYALAISRAGDYPRAAEVYTALSKRFPGTRRGDLASYKIGYLDYDAGNLPEAISHFRAHLKSRPSSKHADEARWFIGWSYYRAGQMAEAKTAFSTLISKHPNSGLAIAGRYWLTRVEQSQGNTVAARKGMEDLLRRHPHSGYAYFAAQRLGRDMGAPKASAVSQPAIEKDSPLHEGALLIESGWMDWARDALSTQREAMKRAPSADRLVYAHLLLAAGDYKRARRFLSNACKVQSSLLDASTREICLPRPESAVVTDTAASSGLDPYLPYAIMTAESALDPSVTSPAGARGLMQLMPFLGEEIHGLVLPDSTYDGERLYLPGYNAWFGTYELGRLYTRFKAVEALPLPMAIAGYNGGFAAVERWLANQAVLPAYLQGPDAFMENIGYTETRRYVRKVLGYLMYYHEVYGNTAP